MRLIELFEKNKWTILASNELKYEYGDNLINLVQTAYKRTSDGSFVNNISDVIPSDWNIIDWDDDPYIDACIFYRGSRSNEKWVGQKIQGIGHDNNNISKKLLLTKLYALLNTKGWWIEASDAMRHLLLKHEVPVIQDINVLTTLFNDTSITMISDNTYTRIANGKQITETVFGIPTLK